MSSSSDLRIAVPGLALVPGRVLETNPALVDFGNVPRGRAASGLLGIRNAGDTAIDQLALSVGGSDRDVFSVSAEQCGTSLGPGRECVARLTFLPTAARAMQAFLIVTGAETQQARVALSGVGVMPGSLTSDITILSFENAEAGTPSEAQTWTITNTGDRATGPLQLENSAADQFSAETSCRPPLLPGASCTVDVRYVAPRRAYLLETLKVSDGMGNDISLQLLGNARARLTIEFAGASLGTISSDTGVECSTDCSLLIDTFTTLTATTANGTNTAFTGWSALPGCDARRECTVLIDTPTTTVATFAAQTHNLAFVSSESFPNDLGEAAAYDAECNRLASEAGINDVAGRAFVAAVSGPGTFWDRMVPGVRGWLRMDGLPLGDTPQSFAAAGASPLYPVMYDEWGEVAQGLVQTGATASGDPSDNCLDWTTTGASERLVFGDGSSGPAWLELSRRQCSTLETAVYCLGSRKTDALAPMPFAGKRLWVTREPLRIGEQLPDEACQLDRPSGVTRAIAFISYSNRRAVDLMDPNATYVRPDGALIGTAEHIRRQYMLTGPWITSDGAILVGSDAVWTGGSPTDQLGVEQTCGDWRDPLAEGGQGSAKYHNFSAFGNPMIATSCSAAARVYCIEE
jgi:hypothetical protein